MQRIWRAMWLDTLKQITQWKAHPWDNHRPGFDTTHTVDTFLERERFDELINLEDSRARHFALDRHLPMDEVLG